MAASLQAETKSFEVTRQTLYVQPVYSHSRERFASAPALLDFVLSFLGECPAEAYRLGVVSRWEIKVEAKDRFGWLAYTFRPGDDPESVDEACAAGCGGTRRNDSLLRRLPVRSLLALLLVSLVAGLALAEALAR